MLITSGNVENVMQKPVLGVKCSVVAAVSLFAAACGGGGSSPTSPNAGPVSGATLTGQIVSFDPLAWRPAEPRGFLAALLDFACPTAHAAVPGVNVSVGGVSTTTDSAGRFTLPNVPTGDQIVTFAQGSSSATYALQGVEANETFVLNGTSIAGPTVTTEHTGSWVGTATSNGSGRTGGHPVTLGIAANGNIVEGTVDIDHGWEVISWSGTENGTSVSGSYRTVSSGAGCAGEEGTFSGSFDGSTVSGTWRETKTVPGCELTEGTFSLSKQ